MAETSLRKLQSQALKLENEKKKLRDYLENTWKKIHKIENK